MAGCARFSLHVIYERAPGCGAASGAPKDLGNSRKRRFLKRGEGVVKVLHKQKCMLNLNEVFLQMN